MHCIGSSGAAQGRFSLGGQEGPSEVPVVTLRPEWGLKATGSREGLRPEWSRCVGG